MLSQPLPFALLDISSFLSKMGLSGTDLRFAQTSQSAPQGSSLEWALVALYLAVMFVLSVYGLHRYQLIYLYYKHRDRAARQPATRFARLPRVTVQLPLYNEQFGMHP